MSFETLRKYPLPYTLACKAKVLRLAATASLNRAFLFAASAATLARAFTAPSPPIIFVLALMFTPTLFLAFVDPIAPTLFLVFVDPTGVFEV